MLDVNKLRNLVIAAVNSSYETDSSTGVLLSGGIDSSSVACIAWDLPVFTGYYKGDLYDERQWAKLVGAVRYHTGEREPHVREWHQIEITPQDFVDHMDDCLACLEAPFEGPGTFGQYMVARYVSQHVETVLSGEGGDELFGGYARLIHVAGEKMPDGYEDYTPPEDYPTNLEDALVWEWDHLPALLRVDTQVTQAHGLTARAPMAEYQPLIDYVLSLDPHHRVGKVALKNAMTGIVPEKILGRTDKRGFPVPYVQWAQRNPVRRFLRDRIGYIPDPEKPWDRQWWLDLCESSREKQAA